MRTLYLPEDGRRSRQTEESLGRSVQDNIKIGPASKTHAAFNVLVTERERVLGQLSRLDVRPWRADTRTPGSVEQADETSEEADSADDLLYGVPDGWQLSSQPARSYTFSSASVLRDGYLPTLPEEVDRAVETPDGLVVQAGPEIWEVKSGQAQAHRLEEGSFGAFRPYSGGWCLASLSEANLSLLPGAESERSNRVDFELQGLNIEVEEPGRYLAELSYTRAERISAIAEERSDHYLLDVRTLDGFVEAGNALQTSSSGDPIETSWQSEHVLRLEGDGTFYFRAERQLEHTSSPGQRESPELSFAEYAPEMLSYPERGDIKVWHQADVLARAPRIGPGHAVLDRNGQVIGGGHFGHEVHAVLPSEHHIIGASRSGQVSLYCPASERVLLSQSFSSQRIRGITWMREGRLGLVLASGEDTLEVRELLDVRDKRIGPWSPTER